MLGVLELVHRSPTPIQLLLAGETSRNISVISADSDAVFEVLLKKSLSSGLAVGVLLSDFQSLQVCLDVLLWVILPS